MTVSRTLSPNRKKKTNHLGLARTKELLRRVRADLVYTVRADLDQCPATALTTIRRLELLARRSLDILLLGDDDLLCLALAQSKARVRIAVVDADRLLLSLIGRVSPGLSIELIEHDLRDPLPHAVRRCFDEVFMDPPYTMQGQLLFIRQAMLALRPKLGVSLYVCASRSYMNRDQLAGVRQFLRFGGFELVSSYYNFNRYKAPPDVRRDLKQRGSSGVSWLSSDLFHYVRIRSARIPRIPTEFKGDIYDYETTLLT